MAKITVEFDTKEKTLSVAVDGGAVADVAEVYLSRGYRDGDDYGCALTTVTRDEAEGTVRMTRLVAAEGGEGKSLRASAAGSKSLPGFLEVPPLSKAQSDVAAFFGRG